MVKCWNCLESIPEGSNRCPECGSGQNLAGQGDDFSFTRPEPAGFDEAPSGNMFFDTGSEKAGKKANRCPVCNSAMQFKERVNSHFCPKCRSFY